MGSAEYRKRLARTAGLKIVRNGDRAWTVTDKATGIKAGGRTRQQAVEACNRLRDRAEREGA